MNRLSCNIRTWLSVYPVRFYELPGAHAINLLTLITLAPVCIIYDALWGAGGVPSLLILMCLQTHGTWKCAAL